MLSFSPSLTEDREHGGAFSQKSLSRKKVRSTLLFSYRDAEDAVYGRNGYGFGDCKLRVEYPRSSGSKFGGSGGGPRGRFGPPSRRSEFRVIVTGRSEISVIVVCCLYLLVNSSVHYESSGVLVDMHGDTSLSDLYLYP